MNTRVSPDASRRHTSGVAVVIAALGAIGCNSPVQERTLQPAPSEAAHSVTVRQPASLGRVAIAHPADSAQKMHVGCSTCHSLREGQSVPTNTNELTEFHKGLQVKHGELSCASCHDQENPQTLRLASGDTLVSQDVMLLCGQCHGPQKRDYDRGAHGGMTGYWDLSRGPRVRNSCVHCHAPHTPAYRGGKPVFAPRDVGNGGAR